MSHWDKRRASGLPKGRAAGYLALLSQIVLMATGAWAASSPAEAAPPRPPFIVATPNPVPLSKDGTMGSTTVRWDAGNVPAQVVLSSNGGREQAFGHTSAGEAEAPWISAGAVYEFRLYKTAPARELLAKVQVTASDKLPYIDAFPKLVPMAAGRGQGATTIHWDAKTSLARVYVVAGKSEEKLFSGAAAGEQSAPWIASGGTYEFRLYKGTDRRELLAKVRVTGSAPAGTSASPASESTRGSGWFGSVKRAIAIFAAVLGAVLALALLVASGDKLLGPREGHGPVPEIPFRSRLAAAAPPLAVLLAASALACGNLLWLERFRSHGPLAIEESEFLVSALDLEGQFVSNGVEGFWRQFQDRQPNGPLQPLAASLLAAAITPDVFQGFVVAQVFYVALVLSVYGIGKQLGGGTAGMLAALVVTTAPGTLAASRALDARIASAAAFAVASWALLKSNQLRNRAWSAACGLLAGLACLSSPSTAILIAGLFLFAGFSIPMRSQDRGLRLANFILAAALALAAATLWPVRNYASLGTAMDAASALLPALVAVVVGLVWKAAAGCQSGPGKWGRLATAVLIAIAAANSLMAYTAAPRGEDPGPSNAQWNAWRETNNTILALIEGQGGQGVDEVSIVVLPKEAFLSSTTLTLFDRLGHSGEASIDDLLSLKIESDEDWRRFLERHAPRTDVYIVTTSAAKDSRRPEFTPERAEQAAAAAGFKKRREFWLPDGRSLRIWQRKG
jgi:hypothetical protein